MAKRKASPSATVESTRTAGIRACYAAILDGGLHSLVGVFPPGTPADQAVHEFIASNQTHVANWATKVARIDKWRAEAAVKTAARASAAPKVPGITKAQMDAIRKALGL